MTADGRILIDTKIDTRGIVDGTDKVISAARRMATQVDGLSNNVKTAFSRQADAIQKSSRLYVEQGEKIDGLNQKLEELKKQEVPTEQYQNVESEIKKTEAALDKLIEKQIRFIETGGKTDGRAFEQMEYDIEQARQKLEDLNTSKEEMEASGTAYAPGTEANAEQISALESKITSEKQKQEEMGRSLETAYESLRGKVEQYSESIVNTRKETDRAANSTRELNEETKKTKNGMMSSVGTMLKYSLGIRSLYALVGKLRSALVEGFKNLSQYSSNTNAALSGLISSLTQCKNALATAFDPILQAIAPALNYMISLVTAAATAVAQLIAIFTGKGTFIKATKVQKDYAKSLKATGGAAKGAGEDAEGALAPFDKLNVMAEETASGGRGGGGGTTDLSPADMFETVPTDNNLTKAIDAIKKKLLELKNLFKKGFWEGAGDLSVLDNIKASVESIRDSLIDIFTDGAVLSAADNMLNTLAYDIGRIAGAFTSVGISIADNLVGGFAQYLSTAKERIKEYLISMFDIASAISTITANFSVSIAEIFTVFRGDTAKQVTADIIAIFANSFMGITELVTKLFRDILDIILAPFTDNVEEIKKALENFLSPVSEILSTLSDSIAKTFDEINKVYDKHLKPLFKSIRDGFSQVFKTFVDGFNTYMAPVLDNLAKKFSEVWDGTIQPLINNAIGLIGDVGGLVKALWEKIFQPFLNWFADTVWPVVAPVVEGIGELFLNVFDAIGTILNGFVSALRMVIQFITTGFATDWGTAWNNMKNAFTDMWNSLPGLVKGIVNKIISGVESMLNGVIGGLNGFTSKVNGVIGKIPGVSAEVIPSIGDIRLPRLASGTIVPPRAGEFAAILGDNNREPEVVSPVSTMKRAFLEALGEFGSTGGGDISLTINLDGKVIYQDVVKRNRAEKDRTGRNLLLV